MCYRVSGPPKPSQGCRALADRLTDLDLRGLTVGAARVLAFGAGVSLYANSRQTTLTLGIWCQSRFESGFFKYNVHTAKHTLSCVFQAAKNDS